MIVGLALLGACDPQNASPPLDEHLDPGHFEYRCVSSNDAFDPCGEDNAFPETVAVGAEFEIHFVDEQGEEQQVLSAAPDKLSPIAGKRFRVRASGPLAVLAMGPDASRDIRALDFLHLNAKPVERIGLRDVQGDEDLSSLRLVLGQVRNLIARPYAADTQQIAAGALAYEWFSSDPTIVSIEPLLNSRTIGLVARREGATMLTVFQGDVERSIDVTVVTQAPPKKQSKRGAPSR